MKNLFEQQTVDEVLSRLDNLRPDSKHLWGKMSVSQMLAHCQVPMEVALGERTSKQRFIGKLFGRMAKRKLMSDGEFKKNLPTDSSFMVKDDRNFLEEKERLQVLVQRFPSINADSLVTREHPFFGRMTREEWGILSYRHLDHHLKQFGA